MGSMRQRCLALLVVAALGGCGDDAPTDREVKADYLKRADRVCASHLDDDAPLQARLVELTRPGTSTSEYLGEGAHLQQRRSRLRTRLADRLRKLPDQPADRVGLERYLAGLDQVAALQQRLSVIARQGDRARYDAVVEELNPIAFKTQGIAQGYGFTVCGSG
jgi:hypothetical protein